MDTKFFTPEIRADVDYIYDFNHPQRQYDQRVEAKFSGPMKSRVTQLGRRRRLSLRQRPRQADDAVWLVLANDTAQ